MKELFREIPTLQGDRLLLRSLEARDADDLGRLTRQTAVYRYLPTFLFEKQFDSPGEAIRRMYDECLSESLILGVFLRDRFCGLAEMYGYRQPILPAAGGMLGPGRRHRGAGHDGGSPAE